MRILMILTYYYPYVSGLSEYVRRISIELTKKGHEVSILTSRHDRSLKKEEVIDGVKIKRCGYLFKFKKWVFMPGFVFRGLLLSRKYDRVFLHLPMPEAGLFAILRKKLYVCYHCDFSVKKEQRIAKIFERVYYGLAKLAVKNSKCVITYTEDYAMHSKLLKDFLTKCRFTYPPINSLDFVKRKKLDRVHKKWDLKGKKVIGFAGRFVYEKGISYLIGAFDKIKSAYPDTTLLLAGEYQKVAGGSLYKELEINGQDIKAIGNVDYKDLADFYSVCDVLVLPSIDPLEAFGIVQVEAMLCGCPVISTDLYGVRVPISRTGMGIIIKQKSSEDIASAVIKILNNPNEYHKDRKLIVKEFDLHKTVKFYEELLNE